MNRNVLLSMILLNAFATPVMLSATNVALPSIAMDFGMSARLLSWVPMSFLMASTMFVLIFSRIADAVGRKRIFLLGTAAVLLSSLYAAMSVNSSMLLSGRFLQGISASMLHATQLAIVSSAFPANQRGKLIGLVTAAVYVGLSAGPLLGGFVVDHLGWRAAFLLQVPLAMVVLLMGVFAVKGEWRADTVLPFDRVGAVGWSVSIALFCIAVTQLPSLLAFALFAGCAISTALFVRHTRNSQFPLWDINLFFSNRTFTLSCATSLLMYSATYAIVVLMSLYLQSIKGFTATNAGMILMIQPIIMATLSPLAGRWSDRIEPRLLATAGMVITCVGLALLSQLDANSSVQYIVMSLVMTGAGFSLFSSPNINAIMGSVDNKHAGGASGAVATTRLLGQLNSMVLVTLAIALIMGNTPVSPQTAPLLNQALSLSFVISAALCIPGILFSLARGRVHPRRSA